MAATKMRVIWRRSRGSEERSVRSREGKRKRRTDELRLRDERHWRVRENRLKGL